MAKQLIQYQAEDGAVFETLEEAEQHECVTNLALSLGAFVENFPEDGYDTRKAAEWLLKTFTMERK